MSTTSDIRRPAVGASVWTNDGKQFGHVKEVKGDYFKVDIPWSPDYWLSCAHIAELDGSRAILRLREHEVDEHRLEQPGLDSVEETAGVFSSTEVAEQRERMERELETQKEQMRSGLQ
ncbi:MAG: hypothetical protein IH609_11540 [Dehalococcoidia bacterium]|nr:hypothetical protein [Dehalococcoidia bacterium]